MSKVKDTYSDALVGAACLAALLALIALIFAGMRPSDELRERNALRIVIAMDLCLMEPACVITPEDMERYQRAQRVLGYDDEQ
jgi:hypothetical protein